MNVMENTLSTTVPKPAIFENIVAYGCLSPVNVEVAHDNIL